MTHRDVKPPQMANALGNVNDLCQNLQALSQAPSVEGLATLVESIQKVREYSTDPFSEAICSVE